jgi:hypothetical protein
MGEDVEALLLQAANRGYCARGLSEKGMTTLSSQATKSVRIPKHKLFFFLLNLVLR